MSQQQALELFLSTNIRFVWDDEQEKYFFSVVDCIQALTESPTPRRYWSDLKRKLTSEGSELYANIVQLKLRSEDGKKRLTDVADIEQMFRIIQSVPSPKAEPLKRWLAETGAKRIDQMIDPELSIQQMVDDYHRLGYSDEWINTRMKSIDARKVLTDEWKRTGVTDSKDFAILTNILTKEWSGKTVSEYKRYKGLTKQNLRDNMTAVELALNTLAEVSTTEISKQKNPNTLNQSMRVAKEGGGVAHAARKELESKIGHSVISSAKATDYIKSVEDVEHKELKNDEE